MEKFSICYKCKYESPGALSTCPQCGRRMQNSTTVRRLGWVALVAGSFLTVFMTFLTARFATLLSVVGRHEGSAAYGVPVYGRYGIVFSGTPKQAWSILAIFVLVIAIGLTSTAGGIWNIRYGKKNKVIGFITLGLALLTIIMTAFSVIQS